MLLLINLDCLFSRINVIVNTSERPRQIYGFISKMLRILFGSGKWKQQEQHCSTFLLVILIIKIKTLKNNKKICDIQISNQISKFNNNYLFFFNRKFIQRFLLKNCHPICKLGIGSDFELTIQFPMLLWTYRQSNK